MMNLRVEKCFETRVPINIETLIRKLLAEVPEDQLIGLDSIILVDQVTHMRDKKSGGLYRPRTGQSQAKIEIGVNTIYKNMPRFVFYLPFIAKFMLANVLYHEIGHHSHYLTHGVTKQEIEDFAEKFKGKILGKAFFWWRLLFLPLAPVVRCLNHSRGNKRMKKAEHMKKLLGQGEDYIDNLHGTPPLYDPYTGMPFISSIFPIAFLNRRKKIREVIRAFEKSPTNSKILEGIEDIGMNKAGYRKLIAIYFAAIDRNLPAIDKAVLHHDLAMLFYGLGKWDKAMDNFEKSMSLFMSVKEEDIDLQLFKAANFYRLYLLSGDVKYGQSAIEQFERAIERYPDYEQKISIYMYLANTYNHLAKYEEALSKCSDAINLASNDLDKAGVYHAMAKSYQGMKKYDLAEGCYTKSLKLYGNDKSYFSQVFRDLGMLYIETGEKEKADAAFRKALKYRRYDPLLKYTADFVEEVKMCLKQGCSK